MRPSILMSFAFHELHISNFLTCIKISTYAQINASLQQLHVPLLQILAFYGPICLSVVFLRFRLISSFLGVMEENYVILNSCYLREILFDKIKIHK